MYFETLETYFLKAAIILPIVAICSLLSVNAPSFTFEFLKSPIYYVNVLFYLLFVGVIKETLNLTETLGFYVRVRAGLNILNQQVTWELVTIDPETGKS